MFAWCWRWAMGRAGAGGDGSQNAHSIGLDNHVNMKREVAWEGRREQSRMMWNGMRIDVGTEDKTRSGGNSSMCTQSSYHIGRVISDRRLPLLPTINDNLVDDEYIHHEKRERCDARIFTKDELFIYVPNDTRDIIIPSGNEKRGAARSTVLLIVF